MSAELTRLTTCGPSIIHCIPGFAWHDEDEDAKNEAAGNTAIQEYFEWGK